MSTEATTTPAAARTMSVAISYSSNPLFSDHSPYFFDLRDTTAGRNRQLLFRYLDAAGAAALLADVRAEAAKQGVSLTVSDKTGEIVPAA